MALSTRPQKSKSSAKLAEEWTYRYLAAAHTWAVEDQLALARIGAGTDQPAPPARPSPEPPPAASATSTAEIRAWALANGYDVADRGRLRPEVRLAWENAQPR